MKKNINSIIFSLVALCAIFVGCKKDKELNHTNVSAVSNLFAPLDNAYLNLGAQSTAIFEWEQAKAADNGVVLYEVVFDLETGDFSKPVYSIPSDGKGYQRTLTISFAELSKIAARAGIEPEGVGKLKWTVLSSKGINVQKSQVTRLLEVERPAGFAAPAEVYLTGSATEGGEDLSKALLMKQTGVGQFEIYTSLKDGQYHFAERNAGIPATYFIENAKLKAEGNTPVSGGTSVYRIKIDFASAATEITKINSVGLWFAPDDKIWYELPYAGNGTWEIKAADVIFKQDSWGRDERYKFRFNVTAADGSSKQEWFGSTNGDNQRPTATSPASYWFMVPVTNDRWNNSFKFNGDVDNKKADIKVVFNSAVPSYTHTVTIK
ncbi:MAG: hypothetical protein JWQ25_432 [Daejeonella sp.]|nr:hypothetical protein [Daejeonella sp.]